MGPYEKAVALWRSWQVRSAADIDLRLDSFRVLFAYHSGRIENPEVTYHDSEIESIEQKNSEFKTS